ncbi:MAG: HEPN domain-containing protein [Candidatus Hydrogenedentes bacterium]|nr:HEPN domain-containing protein [Candidatus Hydrogenedentota bacterium]
MANRIDAERHVEHWRAGSVRSFEAVPTLVDGEFWPEALFWTHLVVEKALKAHVVKATDNFPPFVHNLLRLAELANIELNEQQLDVCQELNKWQLKARYLGDPKAEIDGAAAKRLIEKAREFHQWLLKTL